MYDEVPYDLDAMWIGLMVTQEWGIEYTSRCLCLDDYNICRCPHNAGKPCTYDACPKRRRRMQ